MLSRTSLSYVLRELAQHHHGDEERKFFPAVRATFDVAAREVLGWDMEVLQLWLQADGKPRGAVRQQTGAAEPLR